MASNLHFGFGGMDWFEGLNKTIESEDSVVDGVTVHAPLHNYKKQGFVMNLSKAPT
ncbi:hypothetical protein LTS18_013995 [Coniosporium uncinatum]|uniref:Uncharacterized protein n=1 Tax=Coniosporium uncinatum TaxID=93489 RepID=A0ACC3D8N5_9PEZI|nr:hypothetical protein LTS18_013995 [Coniosporium uncinatum]